MQKNLKMCCDYLAEGGVPISAQLATDLRQLIFGTAAIPMRAEWTQTPFLFGPARADLAYGLRSPRNATRGLLAVVQGFVLKYLLFGRRQPASYIEAINALNPDDDLQKEALVMAFVEILLLVADKGKVTIVLPAAADEDAFVPHSVNYFHDSITEKLYIFTLSTRSDLLTFLRRHLQNFTAEDKPGTLLLLYSAVLTRTLGKIRLDLDSKLSMPLTMANNEEGSLMIVILLLTGRATPYIHNGVLNVGDDDSYSMPQYGILSRCTIGLLIWDNEVTQASALMARQPGSRLKTPNHPIWITNCAGHYGVIFSRNPDLLRNYHAEAHFDLNYYSCSGHQIAMTVDNRAHANLEGRDMPLEGVGYGEQRRGTEWEMLATPHALVVAEKDEPMSNTPLQRLIHTKWPEARIRYHAQPSMLSYLFGSSNL